MNNSWYELKHIAIEKNKANNEVIETSMTPENQRNLISSVTLTILYTSMYLILNLLLYYYCLIILCLSTVYCFIHFLVIILYSWMILFSFRKEIQQKKNLETQ